LLVIVFKLTARQRFNTIWIIVGGYLVFVVVILGVQFIIDAGTVVECLYLLTVGLEKNC
jgi:hypothetical protein